MYKAVIDLVRFRIEKARSIRRTKRKKGIDIESLAGNILLKLNNQLNKFPESYVKHHNGPWSSEIKIPNGKAMIGSDINGFYVQINGIEIFRSRNQTEAKYVYYAALTGARSVKIPKDIKIIESAVRKFEEEYQELREEVKEVIETSAPDAKIRKKLEDVVWKLIFENIKE